MEILGLCAPLADCLIRTGVRERCARVLLGHKVDTEKHKALSQSVQQLDSFLARIRNVVSWLQVGSDVLLMVGTQ